MADDEVVEAAKVAAELMKATGLYEDAFQPLAKQTGKALETVGRAFNVALAPIKGLVWGVEQLETFLQEKVAKKLEATPPEHIITPKANVVAPALDAVRFTEGEVDLQELYANLIASAMDQRVAHGVFPSFVDILKQLTSDEAKILKTIMDGRPVPIVHVQQEELDDTGRFVGGLDVAKNLSLIGNQAGCEYPRLIQSYLDNLDRLGIIRFLAYGTAYTDGRLYREVEADPEIEALGRRAEQPPKYRGKYVRTGLELTHFGRAFINACVRPYEERADRLASGAP
jgi:hypothetical protein